MRDAASSTHALEGLRSSVLEALLTFVYEGSCQVEAGLLTEMLDAAARLVIDSLKAACAFAIQAQLDPSNALDVWRLADLYTLPALEKAAVRSAIGGFEELPLQSASGAQVLALVQEDGLVAKNEEAVFQWVVRWWEAAKRPEAELLAVMKHVRFAAMDAGFVEATVKAWPALDSSLHLVLGSYLDAANGNVHVLPRSGFGPRLVYTLGGGNDEDDGEFLSTVDVYDPRTDAWKQVSSMPTKRSMHGGAALDGKMYAVGGSNYDDRVLSTADVYDPQSNQWQPLANMASARKAFAAAAAGGKIYAIGGMSSDDGTMATAEAFDPLLGAWAEVASMSVTRFYHAAAVIDGKIYAIGGEDADGDDLVTVEAYDLQADSWQQVASMPHTRSKHAAISMGGKIWVSGGVENGRGGGSTNTLIVFDPQANTWTELAGMGASRVDHASAVIGGKLYVFGGYNSDGRTASVEAYDPVSNTWAQVSGLTTVRHGYVAVAL